MSFSPCVPRSWVYLFCVVLCTCYAENLPATLVGDVDKNGTIKQGSPMQITVDNEFEEMKKSLKELQNEIEILKLARENREKIENVNDKLQQCEDKMMETNNELIKLIKDQRNINEEYSKCNLFLTNCMAQTSQKCEKSQDSTQLTVSSMDKLLKEFQVRQWMMTNTKIEVNIDLNEALYASSYGSYTPAVNVLISLGANVDSRNEEGNTPLMKAVTHGNNILVVKLLLSHGASVNAQNNNGWTSLMNASYTHNTDPQSMEIINLLIKHNAEIDLVDNEKSTALMKASGIGNTKIVQNLLSHGAKVDMRDKLGNTSLILACKNQHVKTAMVLLDVEQNLNIQNRDGETALMYAALQGNDYSLVEKLINLGADILVKNRSGKTAINYAQSNRYYNYMHRYINSRTTTTPPPSTTPSFVPESDEDYRG